MPSKSSRTSGCTASRCSTSRAHTQTWDTMALTTLTFAPNDNAHAPQPNGGAPVSPARQRGHAVERPVLPHAMGRAITAARQPRELSAPSAHYELPPTEPHRPRHVRDRRTGHARHHVDDCTVSHPHLSEHR